MKTLVIQCAALGYELIRRHPVVEEMTGMTFTPLKTVFPAVTCSAQATLRTALPPSEHGVICNGFYNRQTCQTSFWNQSAATVRGRRIWEGRASGKTAMLFHQQSLGESVDIVLSPAPIHLHHGGMIMGCQSRPEKLEGRLNRSIGRPFALSSYWGPAAGKASSEWIVKATEFILKEEHPSLLFTYLPHMDYCLQKYGPDDDRRIGRHMRFLAECLQKLLHAAGPDTRTVIWGDYAVTPASRPVFPNRVLLEHGFFNVRTVCGGRQYPNLYDSRAFAMTDHQIAHVFIREPSCMDAVRKLFLRQEGVETVQTPQEASLNAPEAGELVLTAKPDAWFAYRWWDRDGQAPDYAAHVDIHSKIGFDPCELFWGRIPFLKTATDCTLPKGTHGRCDAPAAFAVSVPFRQLPASQLELAETLRDSL